MVDLRYKTVQADQDSNAVEVPLDSTMIMSFTVSVALLAKIVVLLDLMALLDLTVLDSTVALRVLIVALLGTTVALLVTTVALLVLTVALLIMTVVHPALMSMPVGLTDITGGFMNLIVVALLIMIVDQLTIKIVVRQCMIAVFPEKTTGCATHSFLTTLIGVAMMNSEVIGIMTIWTVMRLSREDVCRSRKKWRNSDVTKKNCCEVVWVQGKEVLTGVSAAEVKLK